MLRNAFCLYHVNGPSLSSSIILSEVKAVGLSMKGRPKSFIGKPGIRSLIASPHADQPQDQSRTPRELGISEEDIEKKLAR